MLYRCTIKAEMYVTFEMETKTNKLVLCVDKHTQKRTKRGTRKY